MNEKVGFVILHYLALEETEKCVKSIVATQSLSGCDYCVIIVNNGDERLEALEKMRNDASKIVTLITSKINNGFARGMNLGYAEAKRQGCGFIVLLNNDTLIIQNDFSAQLIYEYRKKAYAVAGPLVLKPDRITDSMANPYRTDGIEMGYTIFKFIMMIIKYLTTFADLDLKVLRWERRIKRLRRKILKKDSVVDSDLPRIDNCFLHGCCLILSPQYVERFDGLNPNTFLYTEELILYVQVRAHCLTTAYLKNLSIIHVGDVATDMLLQSKVEKRRFKYRHHLKSYQVLILELVKGRRNLRRAI